MDKKVGVRSLVFDKLFGSQPAEQPEFTDEMRLVGVAVGIGDAGIIAGAKLHHPQSTLKPYNASIFFWIHADTFTEQTFELLLADAVLITI